MTGRLRADMHVHTYYSDGTQSPAEAVAEAKKYGVKLLVLCDHDGTEGTREFMSLCRGGGIESVTGAEISAYEGNLKLHILAYGMDIDSEAFVSFRERLVKGATERTLDILRKLGKAGVRLSLTDVMAERHSGDTPIHAMHIARAGARKGYESNRNAFYNRYLSFGAPGFSTAGRPGPEETIDAVHRAGGIVSLAHPGRIELGTGEKEKLVRRLSACGLDAMEAVYSGHSPEDTEYYTRLAEENGLLVTGGSDTHSVGGSRQIGTPEFYPDAALTAAIGLE